MKNFKEIKMNRKYMALLGNSLVVSAIMAAIVFGFYLSVIWGFWRGIDDIGKGMKSPGDGVEILWGVAKIMCCGTIALVTFAVVKLLSDIGGWIRGWRVGRV
jgi:hypothetical protein